MKFGLFFMPEHIPGENLTLAYQRDLDQIVLAEKLGYDEVWIGEHHSGGWEVVPAPELMIAQAAARTSRIQLGTGVISLPFHHPFQVAESAAFLDHLTNGRLILGLGAGGLPSDMELFGIPPEQTRPMMRESAEIILKIFEANGEPISYEGQYWTINNMKLNVLPMQKPHPPIAVAGLATMGSYELCGKNGWWPLSVLFAPVGTLKEQGRVYDETARAAGRPVTREHWRITREIYVAETTEKAFNDIKEKAAKSYYDYLFPLGLTPLAKHDPNVPDEDVTLEYMWKNAPWIVGSPEDCVSQIKQLYEEVGGFGSLLFTCHDWTTTENWNHSLELFARYVMPHFK
ncbi:LLM class flavin-dependent oxidoreductase [Alicyclobacillus tolerans]|uniref:LLM class flavin-dependent oxidoreductase n=1 Tax=Alicyclobacillus tolerans TaxID=90970 RepID=UPI001F242E4B|nr:LLM class flavin-dependent oxidoreductase [Alicyclobacillus tolerans]MCF8566860.1 LLM class flavin-dependent oxidoreductase [Alicyclobacillus tolerans]